MQHGITSWTKYRSFAARYRSDDRAALRVLLEQKLPLNVFLVFAESQNQKGRMNEMKILGTLFLAIVLSGSAFAQGKPVSMFGHTLGEPLPATANDVDSYHMKNCTANEPPLDPGIVTCQSLGYNFQFRDGKLVMFNDKGGFTLADAIKKFGPPTSQKLEAKQNTFGARWQDRVAEWVLPNCHVRFEEGHDPADTHNWILLETREEYSRTLAERKAARKNALD